MDSKLVRLCLEPTSYLHALKLLRRVLEDNGEDAV